MAETKVSKKTKSDIQEKDIKTKPKKTKKVEIEKVEKLVDEKISQPNVADDVKVVEDDVKVDVEIDLRSYNHSDVVGGYIRHKRSI